MLKQKYRKLQQVLKDMDRVVIAYSGGVDSTLLAKVAADVLGDKAVCVLASSQTYPSAEVREAVAVAEQFSLNLVRIDTNELENEEFAANTPERCFFCKLELFGKLKEIADERGAKWVLDGSNHDDRNDYRPGTRAGEKLGVRSPLKEVEMTKDEIRRLSKDLGLPTWDKPSYACLSSRIPYGTKIEPEILVRLNEAETFLRKLGFRQLRVRHHGPIARIEVEESDIPKLLDPEIRKRVSNKFEELGYVYTAVDLRGYRTGSMNEVLKGELTAD